MNRSETSDDNDIPVTFKGFVKCFEYPSHGALRKMVYERETNGLKDAFLKIGRRRLVLPGTLFRLLKKNCGK